MTLSKLLRSSVAVAFLSLGGMAYANAQGIVSKKMAVPLKKAEQAMKQGHYEQAEQSVKEAQGITPKSAYEQSVIDHMQLAIAVKAGKTDEAIGIYDRLINAKTTAQKEKINLLMAQASLAYRAKKYDIAIQAIKNYIAAGGNHPYMPTLLIQSYYLKEDYQSALKAQQDQIDQENKRGEVPAESQWLIMANCQKKLDDQKGLLHSYTQLAIHYSKPIYWEHLMKALMTRPGLSSGVQVEIWRLRNDVGLVKNSDDYMNMAEIAVQAGLPELANKIMIRGYSSGVLGNDANAERAMRLRKFIAKKAQDVQYSLNKDITAFKNDKRGDDLLMLGYNQVCAGKVQQGLSLMNEALTMPLTNSGVARLHLAMAQKDADQKKQAIDTLKAIKEGGVASEIAQLLTLRIMNSK